MKHRKSLLLFVALTLCGCGDESSNKFSLPSVLPDKMEGCYATSKGSSPEINIEKISGEYYASFRKDGGWRKEKEPLSVANSSELQKLFRKDADKVDMALVFRKGAFGIFKFHSGANVNGKSPESDYMALIFFGAGPVFPTNCH